MLSCHKHISWLSGDFSVTSNSPLFPFSAAFLVGWVLCFCAVCALGAVRTNRSKAGTQAAVPISFHPSGVFRVAHGRVRYRTGRRFKRCATSTAVGGVVSSVSHIHVGRKGVRSHHITARCLICSESHMSELPHRGVRSHHSMAECVICSESHMSELPHRGVRQNGN